MSVYAFQDYDGLVSAVADWLIQEDLTGRIPQFIRLAEAELDHTLRLRHMIQRRTAVATARYVTLPGDWRRANNVQRLSDGEPLGFMAFDEIDRYRAELSRGQAANPGCGPMYYSLVGNSMELAPAPTLDAPAEIEMIYYASVPRLSEENPSNWLLRLYPGLYLYGALVHSAPFLKDDERLPVWQSMYDRYIVQANSSDAEARYSGAPMTRRIRGMGG